MTPRLIAFVVWAAFAACAAFWGLRLFASAPQAPAHATAVGGINVARGDLARVLGADAVVASGPAAVATAQSTRMQLVGVVAPRSGSVAVASSEGLALISLDGKPPKAYRVGSVVDGDQVLQGVQHRSAKLGPRGQPASMTLDLPPLPAPTTGTLPAAGANAGAAPVLGGAPASLPLATGLPPRLPGGRFVMPNAAPNQLPATPNSEASEQQPSAGPPTR